MRYGQGGTVNGVPSILQWQVDETIDLKPINHAGLQGGTARESGNEDWTGSYTAYGHTPVVMPGEEFVFLGSIDGVKGVTGNTIVSQVQIPINVEAGDPIQYTVNFEGRGALTRGAAAATDTTPKRPPRSVGRKVQTCVVGGEFADMSVRTATLTIKAATTTYNHTGTNGLTGRGKGNYDADLSLSVYCDDFATLPAKGTPLGVRLYVTADTYWEVLWMRVAGLSGLLVDVAKRAAVGATINCNWSCVEVEDDVETLGQIVLPDGTTWWPEQS